LSLQVSQLLGVGLFGLHRHCARAKLPELCSKIERLAESLNAPNTVTDAADSMRSLINRVVLAPAGDGLRAELHGDLAVLARFAQTGEPTAESSGVSARLWVVAGARNHLNLLLTAAHIYSR
jgi:hypothetical protein